MEQQICEIVINTFTCDHYYICDFNGPRILRCSNGYLFDTENRICRPAEQVKCSNTINTDWKGEDNITIDAIF